MGKVFKLLAEGPISIGEFSIHFTGSALKLMYGCDSVGEWDNNGYTFRVNADKLPALPTISSHRERMGYAFRDAVDLGTRLAKELYAEEEPEKMELEPGEIITPQAIWSYGDQQQLIVNAKGEYKAIPMSFDEAKKLVEMYDFIDSIYRTDEMTRSDFSAFAAVELYGLGPLTDATGYVFAECPAEDFDHNYKVVVEVLTVLRQGRFEERESVAITTREYNTACSAKKLWLGSNLKKNFSNPDLDPDKLEHKGYFRVAHITDPESPSPLEGERVYIPSTPENFVRNRANFMAGLDNMRRGLAKLDETNLMVEEKVVEETVTGIYIPEACYHILRKRFSWIYGFDYAIPDKEESNLTSVGIRKVGAVSMPDGKEVGLFLFYDSQRDFEEKIAVLRRNVRDQVREALNMGAVSVSAIELFVPTQEKYPILDMTNAEFKVLAGAYGKLIYRSEFNGHDFSGWVFFHARSYNRLLFGRISDVEGERKEYVFVDACGEDIYRHLYFGMKRLLSYRRGEIATKMPGMVGTDKCPLLNMTPAEFKRVTCTYKSISCLKFEEMVPFEEWVAAEAKRGFYIIGTIQNDKPTSEKLFVFANALDGADQETIYCSIRSYLRITSKV